MNDLRPRRARRVLLRLAAGTVALLALGGPTPGYIGSCDAGGSRVADPDQFCADRRDAECARDAYAGRITREMYNVCRMGIETECSGFNWAGGCSPSPETAAACVDALRDMTRIGTVTSAIPECMSGALCGTGTAPLVSPPDDDGI